MPSTLWSAPVPPLGVVSNSAAVAAALTDYSPQETVIPGGLLNVGTRIRLRASGSYVTSAATATPTWGFYLTNAGSTLTAGTSLALAVTAAQTVANTASASWPWSMEWDGQVRAVSTAAAASAVYFGQGKYYPPVTNISTFAAPQAMPITLALRTVTQVAGGGNTQLGQMVSVGIFPNVTTALTTLTCDELTCELLG
jgi:hypothetical protein